MKQRRAYIPAFLLALTFGCASSDLSNQARTIAGDIAKSVLVSRNYEDVSYERNPSRKDLVTGRKARTETYDKPVRAKIEITCQKEPNDYYFGIKVLKNETLSENSTDNNDLPEVIGILKGLEKEMKKQNMYHGF